MGGSCRQVSGWLKGAPFFAVSRRRDFSLPGESPQDVRWGQPRGYRNRMCRVVSPRGEGYPWLPVGGSEGNADIQQDRYIVDFPVAVHIDGIGGQLESNRDTLIDKFQAGNEMKSVTPIRQVVF